MSETADNVRIIQASITGFSGAPASVLSVYSEKNDVLVINGKAKQFSLKRVKPEAVLIVNNDRYERDWMFKRENFKKAIESYFAFSLGVALDGRSQRLVYGDKASGCDPRSALDRDGIDESGPRYSVREDISNAQVAVLATCMYADCYGTTNKILDFASEVTAFQQGLAWII
ncbi:hypothetical protein [uncultured Parasutterella sp.]|uniref:hypothetical protein n=1 Tax=uncultured Parasutterella sp. TaxID=1263098 RepID=UPI00272B9079|nr:hypothetical protein [uncultured Parasutterella sp.]